MQVFGWSFIVLQRSLGVAEKLRGVMASSLLPFIAHLEAIVSEKQIRYAVIRANQQKILRYWTKYAFFHASFIALAHVLPRLQKNPLGDGAKFDTFL